MKSLCLAISLALFSPAFAADKAEEALPLITTGIWKHEELKRFKAPEANQGVAADAEHIYVITNRALGKYRKDTLARVGEWKDEKGGPFIHMNSGIIHEGKLWCAHSNFPALPMTSSIEIFDPVAMKHVGTYSFGIAPGSLTWIARHQDHWYACFAHYSKDRPKTGRDPAWTELVRYDDQWRRTSGWVFPSGILEIFGGSSCSGGSIAADGTLFITGHDAKQLFVLRFPTAGSVLEWTDTIPITAEGQAFSWDPTQPGYFYGIIKKTREVVVSRIRRHSDGPPN
ncbi:hypothetical protein [Prosthecobacter dejongeii]|uniref:Uncharacterized protein n=1 Tax=Prosthecobacter dejongeii TaxID=48465 RepID=A0A7W8DPU5_9BACT|nr:hypothetical protein [Prosthecobacter dejongeii]MBB5037311.1 hypothetical protein [Prosthecobacter dejongeii]